MPPEFFPRGFLFSSKWNHNPKFTVAHKLVDGCSSDWRQERMRGQQSCHHLVSKLRQTPKSQQRVGSYLLTVNRAIDGPGIKLDNLTSPLSCAEAKMLFTDHGSNQLKVTLWRHCHVIKASLKRIWTRANPKNCQKDDLPVRPCSLSYFWKIHRNLLLPPFFLSRRKG